jgi:prepilin-type N-terminal cleavage/methylation domain-containing protein
MNNRGFSLIELSIVLVILGLLTGGILAGQSLIRAAELRAVGVEYTRYQTAYHSFRDKYFGLPGDLINATAFWGSQANCAYGHQTGATDSKTCNGNGDGMAEGMFGGTGSGEFYFAWQHLANAGLIEGSYTGVCGTCPGTPASSWSVPGTNIPASKLSGAGWEIGTASDFVDDAVWYWNEQVVAIGARWLNGRGVAQAYINPVLRPEEAWNIDTKLDDGKPGRGRVAADNYLFNGCVTGTAPDTAYALTSNDILCSPVMKVR